METGNKGKIAVQNIFVALEMRTREREKIELRKAVCIIPCYLFYIQKKANKYL